MKRFVAILLTTVSAVVAAEPCPPTGTDRADLLVMKANGFIPSAGTPDTWATALLSCLGDPDPTIRDGVVFEAISHWLRTDALAPATVEQLNARLQIALTAADALGFTQPFAALILAEVARSDRMKPVFSPAVRAGLVAAAVDYLSTVTDYRGFDPVTGWRHGVAHGADLVLQLAANPALDASQIQALRTAVTSQIAPAGVSYVFGEPDRLGRAAFYLHRSGLLVEADWAAWIDALVDPAPLSSWADVWGDEASLARRHNTRAFLLGLLFLARLGDTDADAVFSLHLTRAVERMMADGG